MQLGQTIATYCRTCGRVTQSEAVGVKYSLWQEPANEHIVFDHEIEHDLLLCSECQTAQIRSAMRTEQLSEEWREAYVPPHPARELPHWVSSLPNDVGHIRGLLEEVHAALANGYKWLVAMGCRTLIDMFALKRVGDVGGFNRKLDYLQTKNFLSSEDVLVIRVVVEVGHEATHRNQCPSMQDCHRCLDITENLLHRLVVDVSASLIQAERAKLQA